MTIPLYKPCIGREEKRALLRVLRSGKLARGAETAAFEGEFAAYVGAKRAVALNSGTSGLEVLVRALGWKAGDEVISTPFSYIASANCLMNAGVKPVFVDIDPHTLNIDPSKIEAKITPNTKGIVLVHILGLPADVGAIKKIAAAHDLRVIEDACEALGRPGDAFPVGRFDAAVYGFHENKQLTTAGEGGMIATNDPSLAVQCAALRDQGRSLEKDWMQRVILGHNFRMTEIQSAFGRAQLSKLDSMLEQRDRIARRYHKMLSGVRGLTLPQDMSSGKRSWFLYFIMCESSELRDRICDGLALEGIAYSTNYFPPIYRFAIYAGTCDAGLPVAERASQTLLALPTFPEMKDREVDRVADLIRRSIMS